MHKQLPPSGADKDQDMADVRAHNPHALARETGSQAAADIVRRKIQAVQKAKVKDVATSDSAKPTPAARPASATQEKPAEKPSKHEEYLQSVADSGKSLADILNVWHEYYSQLPEDEKQEVLEQFYGKNHTPTPFQQLISLQEAGEHVDSTLHRMPTDLKPHDVITVTDPQDCAVLEDDPRPKGHHRLQSLLFGLGAGLVTAGVLMFGFFNEVVISPFVQPSRTASNTPIIVEPASASVGKEPKIIIPKINVEIPIDYSQTTIDEQAIETALDNGIVHYPATVRPGQTGNAAFFGHSSNNIFNPGKYKFAFVLLDKLVIGDTFYISYEGKPFAYEVISSKIVKPTDVGVLGPVPGEASTATLITCNPPGTSINRLVVVGKQISPDPNGNPPPPETKQIFATSKASNDLPGNGKTLWGRMWSSVF